MRELCLGELVTVSGGSVNHPKLPWVLDKDAEPIGITSGDVIASGITEDGIRYSVSVGDFTETGDRGGTDLAI